ncbi:hypothetical protein [Herbaspirillum sp. B65]|uniref:hypothetical protein n=1 Tax=Herbaspirillum sp. B65 TaxID=137708 RepID=UPI0011D20BDE|nr:hypothetical protein [Herbaspirillum sp. B65]
MGTAAINLRCGLFRDRETTTLEGGFFLAITHSSSLAPHACRVNQRATGHGSRTLVALLLLDFAVSCDIPGLSVTHFSAIIPQGLAIGAEEMSIGSIQENIHILVHITLS